MECADQVFSARVIHTRLAADGRIDLRQQRCRHLHERDPALINRRGEPADITDDAPAQRDKHGVTPVTLID